jgi:hypothetical protein
MSLSSLVNKAIDKSNFITLLDYIDFCKRYLDFISVGLQAEIVSQNENHYRFYQYREEGHFNITRPINSNLMYKFADITNIEHDFLNALNNAQDLPLSAFRERECITRSIYTIQQSIGAALDALPAGESNKARKINGDLFERLIQILIRSLGIKCNTGTVQVPVEIDGKFQFNMQYQHDLLLYDDEELKAIGSVKTSSKDRIDKIFLDKFLYSKLTETNLPHIAIFLNDVQRKSTRRQDEYGINSTFLAGHFKVFTVKLNPLDGVYYCDIRPNMSQDILLKQHIKTIDHFFCTDLWQLITHTGVPLSQVRVEEDTE